MPMRLYLLFIHYLPWQWYYLFYVGTKSEHIWFSALLPALSKLGLYHLSVIYICAPASHKNTRIYAVALHFVLVVSAGDHSSSLVLMICLWWCGVKPNYSSITIFIARYFLISMILFCMLWCHLHPGIHVFSCRISVWFHKWHASL